MAKGRKSKPTHLKLVTGNPGRRPLNPKEAKVTPAKVLPEPPEHLCADARMAAGGAGAPHGRPADALGPRCARGLLPGLRTLATGRTGDCRIGSGRPGYRWPNRHQAEREQGAESAGQHREQGRVGYGPVRR
jgi:hypothetical protein